VESKIELWTHLSEAISKSQSNRGKSAIFAVLARYHTDDHSPAVISRNFVMTQITNTSRAIVTALSPDRKYVLTVIDETSLNSLWLRNVATGK